MKFRRSYLLILPVVAAAAALAAVGTGGNPPEEVVREYDGVLIEKLIVENTSGRIQVSVNPRPRIVIVATKRNFTPRCTFGTEKTAFNEVVARVEKPIGETCDVDLEIQVPRKIDLQLWSNSGAVSVDGVEGKLAINSGSGAVQANGKFDAIKLNSGSGAVDIRGIQGGGEVALGSGAVNLRFLDDPKGRLDVKSGSGHTQLFFPKGAKINAQLSTGSGDVVNEIETSSGADFGVSVKAGAGDVSVKAY